MLTESRLRKLLDYDQETGSFTWKVKRPGANKDGNAGSSHHGYLRITIDYVHYYAHHLAWLYMTGQWPSDEIDHRDTDKSNNRWNNLREATHSQNGQNKGMRADNTSGVKGVWWHSKNKKWCAEIVINRSKIRLGSFPSIDDAAAAYASAARKYHGEFARIA